MRVLIEFKRLDDGPYGWVAEAVNMVGVREYGPTKEAAREALVRHILEEKSLIRREQNRENALSVAELS